MERRQESNLAGGLALATVFIGATAWAAYALADALLARFPGAFFTVVAVGFAVWLVRCCLGLLSALLR